MYFYDWLPREIDAVKTDDNGLPVKDAAGNVVLEKKQAIFDQRASAGKGKGLETMQARAKALQGSFDLSSSPGKGTKLLIWLPLLRD